MPIYHMYAHIWPNRVRVNLNRVRHAHVSRKLVVPTLQAELVSLLKCDTCQSHVIKYKALLGGLSF